ncbi:hypothetical protein M433DRAFT_139886 [Acidomyces richmondensis BFW]|nr:MAG: hypothetical protein FE78DRAFT_151539 [Acidomyces sp. 'richmondensis']KYG49628.1 hypothetical protein M433DRAFT_139886 [Acidomyces richmondensis BFW]
MIEAAKEAGVKRWAPSEYAGSNYGDIDLYQPKAVVWEATLRSGIEYTRFSCGLFTSILGTGTSKPVTEVGRREGARSGEEEALAGLRPWNFVLNMRNGTTDLPGDGTAPLVWTEMRDVATFVFHALDLDRWPQELGMRGDVKSFDEVVKIVERVQNRKFLIRKNTIHEMKKGMEIPGKRFYNQCRIALAQGWGMVPDHLNKAFPSIEPTTCETYIEKWWRNVELPAPAWSEDQSFM